jgi:hypothetical protein
MYNVPSVYAHILNGLLLLAGVWLDLLKIDSYSISG